MRGLRHKREDLCKSVCKSVCNVLIQGAKRCSELCSQLILEQGECTKNVQYFGTGAVSGCDEFIGPTTTHESSEDEVQAKIIKMTTDHCIIG